MSGILTQMHDSALLGVLKFSNDRPMPSMCENSRS